MILTLILLLPLAGAVAVACMKNSAATAIKATGILFSTVAFALSVWLFVQFNGASAEMQFVEKAVWIPSLDVSYHVGVDGISLLLVVLTAFLTPIALLASWESI